MKQRANKLSAHSSEKSSSSKQQNSTAPEPTLLQLFTQDIYQKRRHRKFNIKTMPFRELCQYYIGLRRYMPYRIGQSLAVNQEIQYREDNHLQDQVQNGLKKAPTQPQQPLRNPKIEIFSSWLESLGNSFKACYRFFCKPEIQVSESEQEQQQLHKKPADQPHKIVSTNQSPRPKKD